MAQQTLVDLRSRLKAWSNRSDISDDKYNDFINIALSRLLRVIRIPVLEATATLEVESGEAEIPRDYLEAIDLRVSANGRLRSLERKDISFVQELVTGQGYPYWFSRRGTKFVVAPVPEDGTELILYYYIALQPLVLNTDTNWFVADAPEVLLYGALTELALYNRDEVQAAQWEAKFQNHAQEIQQLANKAEWSGSTLAVHTR
jgi:hypothetical protein